MKRHFIFLQNKNDFVSFNKGFAKGQLNILNKLEEVEPICFVAVIAILSDFVCLELINVFLQAKHILEGRYIYILFFGGRIKLQNVG